MRPIFYSPAPPPRQIRFRRACSQRKMGAAQKKFHASRLTSTCRAFIGGQTASTNLPRRPTYGRRGLFQGYLSPTAAIPLALPQYLEYSPEGEGRGIGEALIGSDVGSKFLEPGGGLRIEEEGEEEGAKLPFPHTPPSLPQPRSLPLFFIHVRLPLS